MAGSRRSRATTILRRPPLTAAIRSSVGPLQMSRALLGAAMATTGLSDGDCIPGAEIRGGWSDLVPTIFRSDLSDAVASKIKGPEIRTGFLKDGKPVQLKKGEEITVSTDYDLKGDGKTITMSYKKLPVDLKPGNFILCAVGTITLTVLSCDPAARTVRCRCENTAMLGERKMLICSELWLIFR
ncbi:uncharacterized protein A4U43_C07F6390 [Asparagus officinalis]|uniref:pyruvate kinase n=1 Tax=Asparagus officinalis TaxID=4686 RepID=A0A5P1E9W6_ASPOF|nr:uncharacterized protein A4U43_C07F6390 [Asparagus officinalis]